MSRKSSEYKATNPLTHTQYISDGRRIDTAPCNVEEWGLRNFVLRIMEELDLNIGTDVQFNMNSNAVINKWQDVFLAEKCYTTVLGISRRKYRAFSYIHEPAKKLCYLMLEEENYRSVSWMPTFTFKVMVVCWYDDTRRVTAVDVEYDQLGFYMHCLGAHALHQAFNRRVTPLAMVFLRLYVKSGVVS
eukprot:CAMPEP_0206060644 /NCGR_PEP_ID=MMETSP1466-20131121/51814_1 /ASSEMBLY_ACC=CAM_ASM_001126 /TAXON_ID=44452 /ORGANISM="Pavlova gyrans, Strain CCMP608" /LENGTH=187 /DNA_ID=CAMNT_0053435983 /DNA_START=12 /DNA_END=571 /DNA_ORIENTATION=+